MYKKLLDYAPDQTFLPDKGDTSSYQPRPYMYPASKNCIHNSLATNFLAVRAGMFRTAPPREKRTPTHTTRAQAACGSGRARLYASDAKRFIG